MKKLAFEGSARGVVKDLVLASEPLPNAIGENKSEYDNS